MGVKGLTGLLNRFAPASIHMPTARDISGMVLAIDTNIFIQRFFRGSQGSLGARHMEGMRGMCRYIGSLDITPIFVFDGEQRLEAKAGELLKRRDRKLKLQNEFEIEQARAQRIEKLTMAREDKAQFKEWMRKHKRQPIDLPTRALTMDKRLDTLEMQVCHAIIYELGMSSVRQHPETAEKLLETLKDLSQERVQILTRRAESLTQEDIGKCRDLVESLGYSTHTTTAVESEAVCAGLVSAGVADATCSEDLDVLAFGDGKLLRGFYQPGVEEMMMLDGQKAREDLSLSRQAFVDLCILCGTDFSTTLERVGPITALKLIQKHGSIESVLELQKYTLREGFQYLAARKVFLDPVQLPFTEREQLS